MRHGSQRVWEKYWNTDKAVKALLGMFPAPGSMVGRTHNPWQTWSWLISHTTANARESICLPEILDDHILLHGMIDPQLEHSIDMSDQINVKTLNNAFFSFTSVVEPVTPSMDVKR